MTRSFVQWLKGSLANTQTRLLVVLTAAVFVIITAVGMSAYYTSKAVLQEELSEPQHQILRIGMNSIDEYIRESDQLAAKIALNDRVYQFLTSDHQASYGNITELVQFLNTMVNSTAYIKSAYIYDVERESMVAFPQGYSSSTANFADSRWTKLKAEEFGDRMMLVKKRSVPSGAAAAGSEITLFRKIMIRGELRGIIAINFKPAQLFSHMLLPSVSHLDSRRFVLDSSGHTLYELGTFDFGPAAAQAAVQQLNGARLGELDHGGRRLLATQIESPVTGWRYLSVVSQHSLLSNTRKIRDAVITVSIAALVTGALAIAYYNAAAFRPVRRMRQLFSNYDRRRVSHDLNDLERMTGELLTDHAQLSVHLRQTMPEAASKLLADIYAGNITGHRDISGKWGRYFQDWHSGPLTVVMVSIDDYAAWSQRFAPSDHSLLKFAVTNIIVELFAEGWLILTSELGRDRMAVLLQPAGTDIPAGAQAILAKASAEIFRLLKFQVSAGISICGDGPEHLRQAMFDAEAALSYRLYKGYGQVMDSSGIPGDSQAVEMKRPPEAELQARLAEAVEAGSGERALAVLDKLISQIREDEWYPAVAVHYMESLYAGLKRLRQGREGAAAGQGEGAVFCTLHLESAAAYLRQQAEELAASYGRLKESKDFILCRQMIDYMQQHLDDPVGVQEIADHTGISVSLASQLFKQEMNETIHGYFTRLRMEHACELLIRTDYKISEIATMVGYQHENSFIRVYRKYKDITPGKYREMMRGHKEALPD
ncbi:AraC family transcriptional regulator [Paenibacillus sp. P96]|uniref:AraC family transcriptional regulator n=1 Tax=Paenibacillus zeirhizosphaerae TaxID=2987519 RepID=A0ABT9FUU7_9BACL|nr:AraC family transcriptional regulator [Paenibacillus sp. P96]MDP4098508.1 AraC family transcriptional regulator [Paenibacillus sp. P96]